jgi:hypothetical protein
MYILKTLRAGHEDLQELDLFAINLQITSNTPVPSPVHRRDHAAPYPELLGGSHNVRVLSTTQLKIVQLGY